MSVPRKQKRCPHPAKRRAFVVSPRNSPWEPQNKKEICQLCGRERRWLCTINRWGVWHEPFDADQAGAGGSL